MVCLDKSESVQSVLDGSSKLQRLDTDSAVMMSFEDCIFKSNWITKVDEILVHVTQENV